MTVASKEYRVPRKEQKKWDNSTTDVLGDIIKAKEIIQASNGMASTPMPSGIAGLQLAVTDRQHTFHSPVGITTYRTRLVPFWGAVMPVVFDKVFIPSPKNIRRYERRERSHYGEDHESRYV